MNSHRFEQHYTDLLVGPWPQAEATYRERSPSSWPERFVGTPLLVLHGADDPVVSVQQSITFSARQIIVVSQFATVRTKQSQDRIQFRTEPPGEDFGGDLLSGCQ